MSQHFGARRSALKIALLGLVGFGLVAWSNAGCEDKKIGFPCDLQTEAEPSQAVYNPQALECPSRICLKPAADDYAIGPTDTGPFCSAACSSDSDCEGQTRNLKDPDDRRCRYGFVCGIPFVKGPICCQKLCMCKDLLPSGAVETPIGCQGEAAATCTQAE